MTFTPGRLDTAPSCGSPCVEFIVASGQIGFGAVLAFAGARQLAGNRDIPLIVDSPGGYLFGARTIARLMRMSGMTVIVARAFPTCGAPADPCGETDRAAGMRTYRLAAGGKCASACTIMVAGATRRIAAEGARFGVHQSSLDKDSGSARFASRMGLKEEEINETNLTGMVEWFAEYGVDPELGRRARKTPPEKMDWLNLREARDYRLVNAGVEDLAGDHPMLSLALGALHRR